MSKTKTSLMKARSDVRRAEKDLTKAHQRLAYCSTAYNPRSKARARKRRR